MTIDDLLARGRQAHLAAMHRLFTPETMPFGAESLNVVTREDFDAYPRLCREFVAMKMPSGMQRTLHILDLSGSVELRLTKVIT